MRFERDISFCHEGEISVSGGTVDPVTNSSYLRAYLLIPKDKVVPPRYKVE